MEILMVIGGLGAMIFFILTVLAWAGRKGNSRKYFLLFIVFFFVFVAGFGSLEVEKVENQLEEMEENE